MDLRAPLRSLNSDTQARVLTVLAAAERPLAGNAVARRAHMSPNAALRALNELVAAGIVWRARLETRCSLHVLDPEHLLVPPLLQIADLGPRLQARLAAHVEDWSPPPATVAARAPAAGRFDEDGRTMVELLVAVDDAALLVDPAWREQVDRLTQAVRRWTGNQVHLLHASAGELEQHVAGGQGESDVPADDAPWLLAAGRRLGPAAPHPTEGPEPHPGLGEQPSSWPPGWPQGPQA